MTFPGSVYKPWEHIPFHMSPACPAASSWPIFPAFSSHWPLVLLKPQGSGIFLPHHPVLVPAPVVCVSCLSASSHPVTRQVFSTPVQADSSQEVRTCPAGPPVVFFTNDEGILLKQTRPNPTQRVPCVPWGKALALPCLVGRVVAPVWRQSLPQP